MKVNKKVFIITILLSLLTVGVLYNYINELKNQPAVTVEQTEVVTALNTIPAYVKITEDMLTVTSISKEAVHPEAILDKSKVVGRVTRTEIIKGEQVLDSRLIEEGGDTTLSYQIPEGMRAATIPSSEISGVGGYIEPKDKIDILVSYSDDEAETKVVFTQFQNIKVIKVGPSTIDAESNGIPTSITVLVTPEQAEVLAFATINGSFHFTLRNPMDKEKVSLDQYGTDNFDNWRDR